MTKPPARTPGEPARGDRDFGPLGGLVDDVSFWERNRRRTAQAEADRLVRDAAGHTVPRPGLRARVASAVTALRRRLRGGD